MLLYGNYVIIKIQVMLVVFFFIDDVSMHGLQCTIHPCTVLMGVDVRVCVFKCVFVLCVCVCVYVTPCHCKFAAENDVPALFSHIFHLDIAGRCMFITPHLFSEYARLRTDHPVNFTSSCHPPGWSNKRHESKDGSLADI